MSQADKELDDILVRLLADVDDDMEFVGSAFNSKKNAVKKVDKSLKKAKSSLQQLIEERERTARVDEHSWYKQAELYQLNGEELLPDTSVRVVKKSDIKKRLAQLKGMV